MATEFDPRLTPARSDLAAKFLEGKVEASRFVEGQIREIIEASAPVREAPASDAPLATEALMGEHVVVYETTDEGWTWGQLEADGYVGWLPANALDSPGPAPTHVIAALRTLAFPGPSIKLPPVSTPSMGSRVAVSRIQDTFAVTSRGHFIPARHLAPIGTREPDFVAVAERFLGTPYLWGGKTSLGIDCSGLVQAALTACGIRCPRDTDMQEKNVGAAVDPGSDFADLRRGDLLFWKRHVAIARDETSLIHANAFHMAVAIEPRATAIARIRDGGSDVTSIRRLNGAC